ncbi:hypothetical protein [Corynebacterium ulcerans]|uniref:hypothetical protein n=1 Tax=Corynebacterium ulcerans TaxID=65058 RepID=UPI0017483C7C|nr:hypothetical protein [Corynebacterium ulcerans]MBH5295503.1 hypothetical protein [Corynebacterium ulcerans]MBH5302780.1 hypothetical protein [Corynebacterium ulcerans]MDK8888271.1 hypothetical protein [Corynebacterium ulcerans]QOE23101.1 hypothetical protein HUF05_00050 [Corynebacterium ulcerans]
MSTPTAMSTALLTTRRLSRISATASSPVISPRVTVPQVGVDDFGAPGGVEGVLVPVGSVHQSFTRPGWRGRR